MPQQSTIFVFSSNLAGRHTHGTALEALERYGAVMGRASGLQGRSYAIPVQDEALRPLALQEIEAHILAFYLLATYHEDFRFKLTPIGRDAGFSPAQIGPMFRACPANVEIPEEFYEWI